MWYRPKAAMAINQTMVIGPKNWPMPPVPRFCTANKHNKITRVKGMTAFLNVGDTTSKPSTADNTEIAGVITPSP